jgi:hypothetical protein
MNQILRPAISIRNRNIPAYAVWLPMLAVSLLVFTFCTVSAQESRIESQRLVRAKRDSLGMKIDSLATKSIRLQAAERDSSAMKNDSLATRNDSLAAKKDSTRLLLVTASPDSTVTPPDTVRVQEAHPQDSPIDRGFLIRTSDGSAELRIRGSVRVNGIYDFNGLQNQSTFNTYDIPVGEANISEPRFQMSAAQTRLGLEATRKSGVGDIFVKVETDFLGPSNTLRLRHAYASVSVFMFGQNWSTFADLASIPLTVDLDGPNGSVSERTVQIRYSSAIHEGLTWDASIESPSLETTIPDSVSQGPTYPRFPDLIGRVRKTGSWGHIQAAGVLRSISSINAGGNQAGKVGYGVLLSGRIYLGGSTPHRLLFEYVLGKAISRYIGTLAKKGLDVVYNPVTQSPDLIATMGGYVSYARQWSPTLLSYVTAGFVSIKNLPEQTADAFHFSRYISGNIFWDAAGGTRVGLEYSFGLRTNKDGANGTANRISFRLDYDF